MNSNSGNPHNLEIGQILFIVPTRNHGKPYTATITKIGRKWATIIQYGRPQKVDMKSLWLDGGEYSSPGAAYLSEQEYRDEEERKKYWLSLYRRLSHTPPACKLETMKQIADMLGMDI